MFHRLVPAVTRYVHGCVVYVSQLLHSIGKSSRKLFEISPDRPRAHNHGDSAIGLLCWHVTPQVQLSSFLKLEGLPTVLLIVPYPTPKY